MATDSPITHVTDTAFWVATYRANEGERPDALFSDPLAARLVEGRGRQIAARMADAAMTAWMIPVRTRMIDDLVKKAIAEGCDVVVNLGAGLDTRPYRLPLPPSLRWIEVDFADTIRFKDERLAGETPSCRLERVAADLSDATARRALLDRIDGEGGKIFVITEGVVPYLSNDDAGALADDLRTRPHFTWWLVEYYAARFLQGARALTRRRRRQMTNAPFKFSPGDWHAFFGRHGWRAKELRYFAEEGARLKRRAPLGWKARLVMLLLPRRVRESLRRGFGYAVLERV
jgi:methyltransferase (TIGR00027 family)